MWTLGDLLMAAFAMVLIAVCIFGPAFIALRRKPTFVEGVHRRSIPIPGHDRTSTKERAAGDVVFLRHYLCGLPVVWDDENRIVGRSATIKQIYLHDMICLSVLGEDGTSHDASALPHELSWEPLSVQMA